MFSASPPYAVYLPSEGMIMNFQGTSLSIRQPLSLSELSIDTLLKELITFVHQPIASLVLGQMMTLRLTSNNENVFIFYCINLDGAHSRICQTVNKPVGTTTMKLKATEHMAEH